MTVCAFAGHREAYSPDLDQRVTAAIEDVLKSDNSFVFYTGDMGEFDKKCSSAVRAAKRRHRELDIKLVLVLPYMTNRLNTDKEFYETYYDDITVPIESQAVHYKAAITQRNHWMVEQSDYLIAYVRRDYGGAYTTLRYANRLKKSIINLAAD